MNKNMLEACTGHGTRHPMRPFWRKRKGNVIDWLGSMIFILALLLLMFAYLNFTKVFDIKEDVKQVSREYMLRMETVGYLTDEDAASLTARLESLGVTGIDLAGSTRGAAAGYGNRIYLVVQCNIPGDVLDLRGDIFNAAFEERVFPFKVIRESTAKY